MTNEQVWERIPDLRSAFEQVLRKVTRCYPALVSHTPEAFASGAPAQTEFFAIQSHFGLPSEAEMRDNFRLGSDASMMSGTTSPGAHPALAGIDPTALLRMIGFKMKHHSVCDLGSVPWPARSDSGGSAYLVAPLPGGANLSSLSLLYLASFSLGMLTRYFPSIWQSLLARGAGDFSFPLIRTTLALIERRFPWLLLQELEDEYLGPFPSA